MQSQYLSFLPWDDEPGGLLDVDLLLQISIQEGRFDVHVVDSLALLSCKS
jgi:hypothetical protein